MILSGGNNISPSLFSSRDEVDDVFDERDRTEGSLIDYCQHKGIPLLGVCRGMFMINVHFGGSITHYVSGHVGNMHGIRLLEKNGILGANREVNSYHNHVLLPGNLGTNIVTLAHSGDGCVEAIQYADTKIYGIAWHPERGPEDVDTMNFLKNIFSKVLR